MHHPRLVRALLGLSLLPVLGAGAQSNPFPRSPEERARLDQLARDDHADMMRQLGITKLRPGANGRAAAGEPGAANYDPARANPYPDWPDVLTLKDGGKVTTAEQWWRGRRPEIAEDFEREVYGRVPADVPKVTWTVSETVETTVGGKPVVARRVIGHVDNSAHPAVAVDIQMAVVLPAPAKGPVPVLMMFGGGQMPGEPLPRFQGAVEPAAPPSTDQLIAAGWGYASLSNASIQADNGAGLTSGIIGLTNRGRRRTPEQWGSLRAWAWGAARALDYLETLPAVDARRVGIEGVSRYGKAALVTMAFEPRFALALVGSSGEGGAKPHRRHFGEQVENLTGSGQYHWMAGNFLKYGAAEASFGSRNASDIPVDAHELIALCAPRPTFISYGVPEKGDALWLDQQGSFMAAVAAGPVFRLLGVRDLGVTEDYRVATMPPVNTGLLDGALAWRQHDGGHEDRSNMSFFLAWADRLAARFLSWAEAPPMGWNSWDAFGTTVTEAQVRAQADFMAANLLPHGWKVLTVDIQWYEPGARGHSYRPGAPLAMDEWGRLVPAPNRFPSAAGGAGFKPLADDVHGRGLQFGIHLMRGIPRLAVARNLPVKGTSVRAADIANVASVCPWNPDMYGVDMARPGAQAYYDSVFELIASWGVDFVKVDDISRPYHEHEAEIEAIRRAIDRTGRPIVLSLSPGETALSAAEHVKRHANMWRISDDFWDTWPALLEQFDRLARWNPHRGRGHWPDADMLPLGTLDLGRRQTRFTPDEQRTLMTLWSIARSPLIHGGDMTKTDTATLALLTNDEVIAVDQRSEDNRPLFDRDGLVAWTGRVPGSPDRYLALFNTRDRYPLDLRAPSFVSPVVTRSTEGRGVAVDVDVRGRARLVLVADGGEDGTGWDHALWVEPRFVMEDGSERRLTDLSWTQASAGWGEVSTVRAPSGKPMTVAGVPVRYGLAAHARSLVEYALPEGAVKFRAFAAIDDGALTQATGATARFAVHALPAAPPADAAGLPIPVALAELGLTSPCRVRDLWSRRDLGTVEREVSPVVPWHGAVLYRLSPSGRHR
jgi:alpha-galactosidase